MAFGLDYVTGPPIADLKSAGVTFVCRYLSAVNSLTQVKLLSAAEAKALGEAGIAIVSNYEWYANRAEEGFASGVADAQIANEQHVAAGGPPDRPIYFSVDFDTSVTPAIIDYFKGVASVIGLHRTGAYGSYTVIRELFDAGAITWGWQTYAWSGGAWESRAHIQQYNNGVNIAGLSVDYNRSMQRDFGQWTYGGTMIPTGWKQTTVNGATRLVAPNGHYLIAGFEQAVLDAPYWDAGNQPNEEESHVDQVQLHNLTLGAGSRQTTRDGVFWYTQAKGVVYEPYCGLELKACYDLIASQQAQIAALKATQSASVDTTALVAAINAIPDAIASAVANALIEAKKL